MTWNNKTPLGEKQEEGSFACPLFRQGEDPRLNQRDFWQNMGLKRAATYCTCPPANCGATTVDEMQRWNLSP